MKLGEYLLTLLNCRVGIWLNSERDGFIGVLKDVQEDYVVVEIPLSEDSASRVIIRTSAIVVVEEKEGDE